MNERNMFSSSHQVLDFANGQQVKSHLHPESCFLLGGTSSFPPSNISLVLPSPGNMNFDPHHLPEHPDGPVFYGMMQYNQTNHPATNLALGVPTASNYFNTHLTSPISGARVFPVPRNHGFVDQLPSSSNHRRNVVPFSEHGRSNFTTDGVRGICEGKDEGIPGNVQHFGPPAGPSTSAAPMASCPLDWGATAVDNPLEFADYRGNGTPIMEVGAGATRHRSGAGGVHMDSAMVHGYNYLPQRNYGGHSFQPSSCTWLEQHSINSGRAFPWSGLPYFQGGNIHGGSSEFGNTSLPGYPEASSTHGSAGFLHSLPMIQPQQNLHQPENISGVRGYGVTCYPPLMPAPSRVPTNDGVQHDTVRVPPESAEPARRPTGIRMYRPHGRNLPDASSRRRDLPRLRSLQADGVAVLEFPSFYEVDYDIGNFTDDNHRDMRLDIDDMSYEELLALSEQIGTVNTGLSEDDITCHLKTRLYSLVAAAINLEELPCEQNSDSCIICQDEYKGDDNLGTLDCGHEYHADCLKKWLLVKNICPICKSSGLTLDKDR